MLSDAGTFDGLRLTFIAPTHRHPIGGVTIVFEFASAMADLGHEVHLFHGLFDQSEPDTHVTCLEEITWFDFGQSDVQHHFAERGVADTDDVPSADVIFGYSEEIEANPRLGLPVVLIQGWDLVYKELELRAYHAPCPKICVSRWLVDVGLDLAVPTPQLVHVPLAIRHDEFRVTTPVDERPTTMSFLYNSHARKGPEMALSVMHAVHDQRPDVKIVAFSATDPLHRIPTWVDLRIDPAKSELIEDIYNRSRIFLCTSDIEGFGLPGLEAMACGAALATTDNGGSRDYAHHQRTALVSPPGDTQAMVDHVVRLLDDEGARVELARAGVDHASEYRWERSGSLLEEFLGHYLDDPIAHGRPMTAGTRADPRPNPSP